MLVLSFTLRLSQNMCLHNKKDNRPIALTLKNTKGTKGEENGGEAEEVQREEHKEESSLEAKRVETENWAKMGEEVTVLKEEKRAVRKKEIGNQAA